MTAAFNRSVTPDMSRGFHVAQQHRQVAAPVQSPIGQLTFEFFYFYENFREKFVSLTHLHVNSFNETDSDVGFQAEVAATVAEIVEPIATHLGRGTTQSHQATAI